MSSSPSSIAVERVADVCCQVGESPLWSAADQSWYWVDIEGRAIFSWGGAADAPRRWGVDGRPGCVALAQGGGLVCAVEDRIEHLALEARDRVAQRVIARIEHPQPNMRLNDGRADRNGRFWVGSMATDMSLTSNAGELYCWSHSDAMEGQLASPKTLLKGLVVPNGLAFSPDGRTLYLSDSHPSVRMVWAFDLDAQGLPQRQRVFADMNQHPGRPDGAAVDVDGCYWICANDAGLIHRFTPEGRLDRSIRVPVSKPSMCAFGGSRMDELLISTIRPAQPPVAEAELAGSVFICRPGASGIAEQPVAFSASV
jgi:sugar lactone lactonase YvrE